MTVVFSDVGGTIFEGTPWPHLRKHPLWNKSRNNWQLVKFLPIYFGSKANIISETSMRQNWLKGMAKILEGISRQKLNTLYQETIENELQSVMRSDVIKRLQQHKASGATVILVSGIFTELVQLIADSIGIDGAIGTQIEFVDNVATGNLHGIPCVGTQKIAYIEQYMQQNHPRTHLAECYAYADSYSDRSLLSAVGHSVATYPDEQIRQLALSNNWEIIPS